MAKPVESAGLPRPAWLLISLGWITSAVKATQLTWNLPIVSTPDVAHLLLPNTGGVGMIDRSALQDAGIAVELGRLIDIQEGGLRVSRRALDCEHGRCGPRRRGSLYAP